MLITALALGACASREPVIAQRLPAIPGIYLGHTSQIKISRGIAAENGHGGAPAAVKPGKAPTKGLALLSEQMALLQKIDAAMGRLKKVMDAAAYESLMKRMITENAKGDSALAVRDDFMVAYARAFPKDKVAMEAIVARLDAVTAQMELTDDKGELVVQAQIAAELKPKFLELAQGIPLSDQPTPEEMGAFLKVYYERLTTKLVSEKMNVSLAFGLGYPALENLPEINANHRPNFGVTEYMSMYTKDMIPYLEKFGKKHQLDNFFIPSMKKFLRETGVK